MQWPSGVTPTQEYQAAVDFIREEDGHLFITGRAGTGKSTLLRAIREWLDDKAIVLAPTGLSAVNVGGQTIHSFFGFPPRLIGDNDIRRSRNGRVMRQLDYVIIDEISMVRSDVMSAIDRSLRLNRRRASEPFGGIRLILFGDLYQLSPVVRGEEAQILEENYGGPYFFTVPAFNDGVGMQYLELEQVFRQTDEVLVEVLNSIRSGNVTNEHLDILNTRVHPIRTLSEGQSYVILTPTNAAANRINLAYLNALPGEAIAFEAGVSGDFNANAFPTEAELTLKPGAKVMLLRNDPDQRWVNGTIAEIARLKSERVWVRVAGRVHEIEPVSWENRRYALDQDTQKVVETIAGTFKQFPLRLAWAPTIHKSQGLTLDQAYIDFGRGTFAHGQAYVALSRCRSLASMALARQLRFSDILFGPGAAAYENLFQPLQV